MSSRLFDKNKDRFTDSNKEEDKKNMISSNPLKINKFSQFYKKSSLKRYMSFNRGKGLNNSTKYIKK